MMIFQIFELETYSMVESRAFIDQPLFVVPIATNKAEVSADEHPRILSPTISWLMLILFI